MSNTGGNVDLPCYNTPFQGRAGRNHYGDGVKKLVDHYDSNQHESIQMVLMGLEKYLPEL